MAANVTDDLPPGFSVVQNAESGGDDLPPGFNVVQPSMGQQLKRQAGLQLVRTPIKAVAALPLMAMDAGVGTRNYLRGEDYELPSKMFDRALDEYLPKPETGLEKGIDVAQQVMLGGKLPAPKGPRAPARPQTQAAPGAQKAMKDGYVLPPSQIRDSLLNRTLEGVAGKVTTAQHASVQNAQNTQKLVARDFGLDPQDLNFQNLSKIRAQAGKVYDDIKSAGPVRMDGQYLKALRSIVDEADALQADYPGANVAGRKQIQDMVSSLARRKASGSGAVEYLKRLRADAKANWKGRDDPSKLAMARAQDKAAEALEGLIERNLASRGRGDLAKEFKAARQMIARTYTAQAAMSNSGQVSAAKLAKQLEKGKPLSGGIRKAAEFGANYKKFARDVEGESFPEISPWDVGWGSLAGVGGALATGNPLAAVGGLAYPAARIGLRRGFFTQGGQNFAARGLPRPGMPQGAPMGSMTGANALAGYDDEDPNSLAGY